MWKSSRQPKNQNSRFEAYDYDNAPIEGFAPQARPKKAPKQRPAPSFGRRVFVLLVCLALGLTLGIGTNMGLFPPLVDRLCAQLGIWVFLAVLITSFCYRALPAGWRLLAFWVGAAGGHFWYTGTFAAAFPMEQIKTTLAGLLLAVPVGILLWFAHADGLFAGFCIALPLSLLLAEGFASVSFGAVQLLTLLMAAALWAAVPRGPSAKTIGAFLAVALFFLWRAIGLLPWLYALLQTAQP